MLYPWYLYRKHNLWYAKFTRSPMLWRFELLFVSVFVFILVFKFSNKRWIRTLYFAFNPVGIRVCATKHYSCAIRWRWYSMCNTHCVCVCENERGRKSKRVHVYANQTWFLDDLVWLECTERCSFLKMLTICHWILFLVFISATIDKCKRYIICIYWIYYHHSNTLNEIYRFL